MSGAPSSRCTGSATTSSCIDARGRALAPERRRRRGAIADRQHGRRLRPAHRDRAAEEPAAPMPSCASATPTAARSRPAAMPRAASPQLLMRESGSRPGRDRDRRRRPAAPRHAGDGRVTVDMGPARLDWREIPLARAMDTLHLDLALGPLSDPVAVNIGNPHAVFFVADAEAIDLDDARPAARAPSDVSRARQYRRRRRCCRPTRIRLRVWERGAGITLACGTGACAALVAAVRRGLTGRQRRGRARRRHARDRMARRRPRAA